MLTIELFETENLPAVQPTLYDALKDFLPIAMEYLRLDILPQIKLKKQIDTATGPTFGNFSYSGGHQCITLGINTRHPVDILRTLAHELTHFQQFKRGKLSTGAGEDGSPIENEANAEAGVILRKFNTEFPQYLNLKPIQLS